MSMSEGRISSIAKRIGIVLGILLTVAAILLCVSASTKAAEIEKRRGRVIVDLDDFQLEEATSKDCGFSKREDGSYRLHYANSFTDRNNIGATYRSKSTYDFTDVEEMEVYMYSDQDRSDKIFIYADSKTNQKYHRWDDGDLDAEVFEGRGGCWESDDVTHYFGSDIMYDYFPYQMKMTPSHDRKYVFIGISHEFWGVYRAEFFLDNASYSPNTAGGHLSLKLKEHKIAMLPVQDTQRLREDGSKETYKIATNLQMSLDDGKTYEYNSQGSIYRDERVVLQYTLTDPAAGRLHSLKFYSDKDKKHFLYEKVIDSSENQTTIIFDSELIRNLETVNGVHKPGTLGDVYFEPVFERIPVTVEWATVLPEAPNVQIVKDTNAGNQFKVMDTDTSEWIGTITMNGSSSAYRMGDMLTLKYTQYPGYRGDYRFQYYEMRACESKNQVNGTYSSIAACDPSGTYDVSMKLDNKYLWIQGHARLTAHVNLPDKTVTYNSNPVKMDGATIQWPEGEERPTGEITYTYYQKKNDSGVLSGMLEDAPVNAGTYYVTATMAHDNYYAEAVSAPATLRIEKALPILSNLRGSTITYGELATEKSNVTGKAIGVTGQTIPGNFNWTWPVLAPNAGTCKEEVTFYPDAPYKDNYGYAKGMAVLMVEPATPTIIMHDQSVVYDGSGKEMFGTEVIGITRTWEGPNAKPEKTGQQVIYEYYRDAACKDKMSELPVEVGTYYVLAKVYESGNYGYAKTPVSEAGILTITPGSVVLSKPEQEITVLGGESVYNGQPHSASVIRTEGQGSVTVTNAIIRYKKLNTDGTIQERPDVGSDSPEIPEKAPELAAPTEAGTYLLEVTVPGTEIYHAYHRAASLDGPKIVIMPAAPEIMLEDKTVTYNGQPQGIGEAVTTSEGAVTYHYTGTTVSGAAYDDSLPPTHAGTYRVSAAVAAEGNFGTAKATAVLTIEPAVCRMDLDRESALYDGSPKGYSASHLTITGVNGEVVGQEGVTYYYKNPLTQEITTEPTAAGIYYAYAKKAAVGDYVAAHSNRALFLIRKAEVQVSLKAGIAVSAEEDIEAELLDYVQVLTQHGADVTKELRDNDGLTLVFYRDGAGSEKLYGMPTEAGTYYVQVFAEEQYNYRAGESGVQKIVIEKAQETPQEDIKSPDTGDVRPKRWNRR